ncbi:hypothetical protein G6F50_017424 [Rhizopus delemar]|uniref:Uncharacterized protein n=1 Tax=Rhizopus delemar TaxID=936053 RepID=A0A9P6XQ26_9FUNG|nr:hypothetical protein G6F50_017424 [Rhizopus delemar]
MQQQLHAVIGGQREMARRHDAGELSYRIDASAFPGEYGLMVQETNALVGGHVQTLHDVLDVVQQYAVGDLSHDIARNPDQSRPHQRRDQAAGQRRRRRRFQPPWRRPALRS